MQMSGEWMKSSSVRASLSPSLSFDASSFVDPDLRDCCGVGVLRNCEKSKASLLASKKEMT